MDGTQERRSLVPLSMLKKSVAYIGIILILGLLGCERQAPTSATTVSTTNRPDQVSFDAQFVMTKGSARRAEIFATRMEHYRRGDSTYALLRGDPDSSNQRVTAYLYTEDGDSSATLRANRMMYFEDKEQFEAFGRVVVTTQDHKRLESEHLAWNEADRTIRTPGFVRITTPSEHVEGQGLVADENLDTYQIGRFTARVDVDEDTTQ